jgi:UDP-2,3-diacylglucosamine pyrophosphatase LpxH
MFPPTGRERLVIVSDLHMSTGAGPIPDPFSEDAAFAGLLDALAGTRTPTRLVLLGDTFDLVLAAGSFDMARGSLDAIAKAHPGVFRALGAFAGAGHSVVVVPGNHDIALLRGSVQQQLRELIANEAGDREAGARIAFRPWIVHVPGVLYAEHGQQHHDINHFRSLLSHAEANAPPGLCLDDARVELARLREYRPGTSVVAVRAAALAGRVLRAGVHTASRRGPHMNRARERLLLDHAAAIGLPGDVLLDLDRRQQPTVLRIAARMVRTRATPGEYMVTAARIVSDALADATVAPAFCVFGHTHVAADRPVWPDVETPRYLNAGTWSTMVRRGRSGTQDRLRYIEIDHGANRPPAARLRRWDQTSRDPIEPVR